jgi:hypothetical protein
MFFHLCSDFWIRVREWLQFSTKPGIHQIRMAEIAVECGVQRFLRNKKGPFRLEEAL